MTKPTGVGRGGPRPGAGRPKGSKNKRSWKALLAEAGANDARRVAAPGYVAPTPAQRALAEQDLNRYLKLRAANNTSNG
jgi:hypothetical protein